MSGGALTVDGKPARLSPPPGEYIPYMRRIGVAPVRVALFDEPPEWTDLPGKVYTDLPPVLSRYAGRAVTWPAPRAGTLPEPGPPPVQSTFSADWAGVDRSIAEALELHTMWRFRSRAGDLRAKFDADVIRKSNLHAGFGPAWQIDPTYGRTPSGDETIRASLRAMNSWLSRGGDPVRRPVKVYFPRGKMRGWPTFGSSERDFAASLWIAAHVVDRATSERYAALAGQAAALSVPPSTTLLTRLGHVNKRLPVYEVEELNDYASTRIRQVGVWQGGAPRRRMVNAVPAYMNIPVGRLESAVKRRLLAHPAFNHSSDHFPTLAHKARAMSEHLVSGGGVATCGARSLPDGTPLLGPEPSSSKMKRYLRALRRDYKRFGVRVASQDFSGFDISVSARILQETREELFTPSVADLPGGAGLVELAAMIEELPRMQPTLDGQAVRVFASDGQLTSGGKPTSMLGNAINASTTVSAIGAGLGLTPSESWELFGHGFAALIWGDDSLELLPKVGFDEAAYNDAVKSTGLKAELEPYPVFLFEWLDGITPGSGTPRSSGMASRWWQTRVWPDRGHASEAHELFGAYFAAIGQDTRSAAFKSVFSLLATRGSFRRHRIRTLSDLKDVALSPQVTAEVLKDVKRRPDILESWLYTLERAKGYGKAALTRLLAAGGKGLLPSTAALDDVAWQTPLTTPDAQFKRVLRAILHAPLPDVERTLASVLSTHNPSTPTWGELNEEFNNE